MRANSFPVSSSPTQSGWRFWLSSFALFLLCLVTSLAPADASPAQPTPSKASTQVSVSEIEKIMQSGGEITLDMFNKLPNSRITKMRDLYLKAVNAYKRGDVAEGKRLQRQLKGYPLNIWLDYYYLAYDLDESKFDAVMKFINSGEQHELATLLKARYAAYFSRQRDYKRLATLMGDKPVDDSKGAALKFQQKTQLCRFYEANWALDRVGTEALTFATKLYLDLARRPNDCNGLISLMESKGYLDDKLKMKRFEKAYVQSRATETTEDLAKILAKTEFSDRVLEQMELYEEPAKLFALDPKGNEITITPPKGKGKKATKPQVIKLDEEETHRVAVLAFKRYANLEPRSARHDFKKFIKTYEPSEAELVDIYQIFASSFLGRSYGPDDIKWVDRNLPAVAWSNDLKEQRLRRAIYFADWRKVYVLIDHLPNVSQSAINWRYWKGRAALELGKKLEGNQILSEVAKDRSFFGFYAAQELGVDYAFNYVKIDPKYSFPLDVATNKAAMRFLELHALEDDNAIYEWRELSKRSPIHEGMVMAQWALSTGEIQYAIDYVITAQQWDALDYRFPLAYRESFEAQSKEKNLPISFLYGISRQESMLNPKVKSWAGAVGLMQLMPGTARDIARKEKWKYEGSKSLTDPETNIQYGSTYIRWMLDKFDNNRILAAAAYNAGPGRIPQWRSKDGRKRDVAMYVESIPFKETRQYVQNVILYDAIYNYLLTGKSADLIKANELSYAY